MSNRAWVTLATNDSYGLGALVLAHSLRRAGSAYPAVVLITPSVTDAMRDRLGAVFAEVITVDVLDSRDAAHLALLQRPELGITFTKIHCWSLTQYEKCVFLDADTLIIQNCDELFEREELSAAPDVGWPDCFNSGVFVFVPSADTYSRLITFAQERGSFDGGDQGLLNAFFSDWAHGDIKKHLPFLYNVTSAAIYSYIPALKHYGQNLKIIHFIGAAKPWLQQFNWESRSVDASSEHLRQFLQLWWDLFVGQVHTQLDTSMDGTTEVAVEEAPPVLPPADVQQHYAPKLDPQSEFPWHHPDVQTQNTDTEAHTLDMSQFYDPWEVYKGSPQQKEHSSSRHAEYHPEDSKKDTKIHPWTHQTSQYVSSQPQTRESNPQSSWPQQNPQSYHNPDQQQYQVQIHQPHYQQQSHYDHTHHQQVDHSRYIPDQSESCHQHTQPSSQNCPEKSNEHHGPYQEHVHSQQHSDHSHNNKSFNLPQHNNDHSQHVQTQIPTNLSGGYEHTQQSHDHISQPHNQQSHENNEGQRESVHNEEHGHNHVDPQVSSADSSPKQNENRPEQHDYGYVHLDFHAIQQERVERVFHLHLDGARQSRRNRTMNGNHAPLASGEIMNGHVSESDGENDEDFRPRHPYDGFYLRHISTVDARGHKICSHEIPPTPSPTPSPPETPPLLVSPSPTPTTDEFVSASDGEEQTGVAGNLARVVPGELGYQREALDELSRRQGWEAGNIDYMGADSFANIWAKISQTLNQPRTSPPKQPSPPKEQPQPAVPQEAAPAETPVATDASAPAAAPASVEAPVPAQEDEAPAPVEAVAPVEAPAPAEAPASVDTPAPVEAAAPVETLAPVDAPAPTEALPPVEAPAPADVPAPPEIPAPVEATSPTEAPAPTAAPVSTEAPAPVVAPVPADASAPVEAPAAADTVTVDAPAPSVTPAPASSEAPVPTEVPSTAEIAPAIEAPATSDVAAPVESPVTAAIAAPVAAPAPVEATPTAEATPVDAVVETKAATTEPAPAEAPKSEVAPAQTEPASAPAESELPKAVEPAATSEPAVEAAAPKEEVKEKTEIAVPPTPPVTPKSTPESSTPVTETPPQLEAASETQSAPAPAESPKAAKSEAAPTSPAPAAIAPEPAKLVATPEKALDTSTATAASTDSPPLVQTPSKEAAPAVPAAKSEERRKPAGKLQLSPPAAADPLPTPDSEQEDAAALAQSIIASELSTCVTSPSPSADPASPPPPAQDKRLAVEGPEVPTPPVSLAQIGVKPKGKATTAAQIESSVSEKAEPATPPTPTPAEPSTPTEAPKKKVVKKVVKKEAGSSGDVPSPVPPPRKKEKKPKEK